MSKTFGIIGVGGFIAPKHLMAIKANKCNLICAIDQHDSVGILDSYFPQSEFFTETERFERYINKLKQHNTPLDFMSICSPNHLHDTHIRLALHNNISAICEKPIVLNPWNLEALIQTQKQSASKIWTILQLRLHPSIIALRQYVQNILQKKPKKVFDITLSYITARGKWYLRSWKGDESKSGGIATNIGVHFFDMLLWIFGELKQSIVHTYHTHYASGYIMLKHARIRWFLSIDETHLPDEYKKMGKKVYRSLLLDEEEFSFSEGFDDLHVKSYRQILCNQGFECIEAKASIELIYNIRQTTPIGLKGEYHPFNIKLN